MNTAIIKPQWSPLTIGLMVLGFIIFWPLGLAMLAYIIWGEKFGGSAEKAQAYWNKGCGYMRNNHKHQGFGRDKFDAFHEYMANLRKAKDREEFDRFMGEHRGQRQGYGENDQNNNNWSNNNGH